MRFTEPVGSRTKHRMRSSNALGT